MAVLTNTDIYSYISISGSTGKTTKLVAAATVLAMRGWTVRVIDLDPQCNASTWLGHTAWTGPSSADLFDGEKTMAEVEVPARLFAGFDEEDQPLYETIPNLTLVPACTKTMERVMKQIPAEDGGVHFLRDAIIADAESGRPQPNIILVDGPGQRSDLITAAALAATAAEANTRRGSHGVVTVTKAAGKELEGLPPLVQKLKLFSKTYRVEVELLAIVPSQVPSQFSGGDQKYRFPVAGGFAEMLEDLEAEYDGTLVGGVTPPIRHAVVVNDAYGAYCPLPLYGARARKISEDVAVAVAYMQKRGMFIGGRQDLVDAA